jgi:hypothetical protein
MDITREQFSFPTRNYPYRDRQGLADEPAPALDANKIYRFVLGLDKKAREMTGDEVSKLLCDPFAELLLKRGTFSLTLRSLLSALDALNSEAQGLPEQKIFLIADGGQVTWTPDTNDLNRLFRFAIIRVKANDAGLLISSSSIIDSEDDGAFLQLIGWDEKNKVFNYYERRSGAWIWAGNSLHALEAKTRGKGPFDSHVNGSLVMKELRVPWHNWHSQAVSIQNSALAPDDPLRTESIFQNKTGAEELELFVRAGIRRWNQARFIHFTSPDQTTLLHVPYFLRQILETTTVNLVTSAQRSRQITDSSQLRLPPPFFINLEALEKEIGIELDLPVISVNGKFYRDSLVKYDFALKDETFTIKGDTFFAFLVPEPAFEDLSVLSILLEKNIISKKFAACLLMIDFQNPVFSEKRRRLMQYVPESASLSASGEIRSNIEAQFLAEIEKIEAALPGESAEAEFLGNWRVAGDSWKQIFESRIKDYFTELQEKALSGEGFDAWVQLADSRRREFRKRRLAEFRLTTPTTNIPDSAPLLEMTISGEIHEKPNN